MLACTLTPSHRCARTCEGVHGGQGSSHMQTGKRPSLTPPSLTAGIFRSTRGVLSLEILPRARISRRLQQFSFLPWSSSADPAGMSLFIYFGHRRGRERGSLAFSCTRPPPGHVHPGSQVAELGAAEPGLSSSGLDPPTPRPGSRKWDGGRVPVPLTHFLPTCPLPKSSVP